MKATPQLIKADRQHRKELALARMHKAGEDLLALLKQPGVSEGLDDAFNYLGGFPKGTTHEERMRDNGHES